MADLGPTAAATEAWLQRNGVLASPLGQSALALAAHLDRADEKTAPPLAKELRAHLRELAPRDGGDEFTRLMAELSAEVRDSAAG